MAIGLQGRSPETLSQCRGQRGKYFRVFNPASPSFSPSLDKPVPQQQPTIPPPAHHHKTRPTQNDPPHPHPPPRPLRSPHPRPRPRPHGPLRRLRRPRVRLPIPPQLSPKPNPPPSHRPDTPRLTLLTRAHALGLTLWDTASAYGDSELLLGKWFASDPSRRASIFLASKFGLKTDPATGGIQVDSSPAYCREQCEESLRRLGTGWIDLYHVHRVDGRTPVEETMGELVRLKEYVPSPDKVA